MSATCQREGCGHLVHDHNHGERERWDCQKPGCGCPSYVLAVAHVYPASARAEPPAAFDAASKKREMETQAQIEDAAETLRAVAEPPAEAERAIRKIVDIHNTAAALQSMTHMEIVDFLDGLRAEPPAPPRLSGQPSESERGEPQEGRGPCAYCGKPTVNAMFLIGEGTQVWHLHCRDLAAAPSPAQPTEEGGSAEVMSKSRLKRLEAQFANSLYVCGGCGKNVPENVPCPFCAAAPSPPASARERCLETVADAMTVAVGYVEAMREHPPDAAVIVNLRGLLENARTVLRSALDTERGKK